MGGFGMWKVNSYFFTHRMGAVRGLQLKVLLIPRLDCDQEQLLQ